MLWTTLTMTKRKPSMMIESIPLLNYNKCVLGERESENERRNMKLLNL